MKGKIAILPGDGIGPEVTAQSVKVLEAIEETFGHQFKKEYGLIGAAAIDKTGNPFPKETESLCQASDAILFGAIGDPKYDNDPKAKVRPEQGLLAMRKKLGLFANIRPVKSYKALNHISPLRAEIIENVDFVVFRELTGGIYFGKPRGRSEDGREAFDTCIYSITEIERVAHLAFAAAQRRSKKLTLVDKANVLATSRLWRETVQGLSKDYPDVALDFMFVDNAAMQVIQNPAGFDVILTENMFGDIITDEASVITGSLGMLPSASVGNKIGLYEPIHGSYPQAAGQDRANPLASILSLSMLLENSFGLQEESDLLKSGVQHVIDTGMLTEDLKQDNPSGTKEVGAALCHFVKKNSMMSAEN